MPPLSVVAFLALAGLTLGSAGIVAFSKNIIHSSLALLGTFMGIAGLYITLSADFLAATQILVYKVYYDGVKAADLGGSSAQSVVLMLIVVALTVVQFRFVERKVQY